jgi:hypothetical protein
MWLTTSIAFSFIFLNLQAKKNGLVMVNFFSYFLTCSNKSSINDVVGELNLVLIIKSRNFAIM